MVSKARLDLPEPESPVTTIRRPRGNSRQTFLRLWTRAPWTAMVVRGADFMANLALPGIGNARSAEERHFMDVDVAAFGQPDRERCFADQSLVCKVFACAGHAFDAEVTLEIIFDLGSRASFADL